MGDEAKKNITLTRMGYNFGIGFFIAYAVFKGSSILLEYLIRWAWAKWFVSTAVGV